MPPPSSLTSPTRMGPTNRPSSRLFIQLQRQLKVTRPPRLPSNVTGRHHRCCHTGDTAYLPHRHQMPPSRVTVGGGLTGASAVAHRTGKGQSPPYQRRSPPLFIQRQFALYEQISLQPMSHSQSSTRGFARHQACRPLPGIVACPPQNHVVPPASYHPAHLWGPPTAHPGGGGVGWAAPVSGVRAGNSVGPRGAVSSRPPAWNERHQSGSTPANGPRQNGCPHRLGRGVGSNGVWGRRGGGKVNPPSGVVVWPRGCRQGGWGGVCVAVCAWAALAQWGSAGGRVGLFSPPPTSPPPHARPVVRPGGGSGNAHAAPPVAGHRGSTVGGGGGNVKCPNCRSVVGTQPPGGSACPHHDSSPPTSQVRW